MGKNLLKKYSKIEVIYVIKIPVCNKSIPKPRIIPKSRFYCIYVHNKNILGEYVQILVTGGNFKFLNIESHSIKNELT